MARDRLFRIRTYHLLAAAMILVVGCETCNETTMMVTSSSVMKSPNFPANYPADVTCEYRYNVATGYRMRIQFVAFHVELSENDCGFDSLRIYDGQDRNARPMWSFCGSNLPPNIVSSGGSLYGVFSSDHITQTSGFSGTITRVLQDFREPLPPEDDDSCTTYLQHNAGALYSTGFPNFYPETQDCLYIMDISDPKRHILLRFLYFELESSYQCEWDYVEIRDGMTSIAPLIGRYCGEFFNRSSDPIISTGPELRLEFHSDNVHVFKGFYAEYASSELAYRDKLSDVDESEEQTFSVCDYSHAPMVNRGGIIVSHRSYPKDSYKTGTTCSMMFIGSNPNDHIFINIVDMDLPYSIHTLCHQTGDFLKITDEDVTAPVTHSETFCGVITGAYSSSSFAAKLQFTTDKTDDYFYKGFKLVYSVYYIDPDGCENGDFYCSNSRCIDASLVCDEYDHCGDNSDEKGCDGTAPTDWVVLLILLGVFSFFIACCGWAFSAPKINKMATHPIDDRISDDGQVSTISGPRMDCPTSVSVLSLDSLPDMPEERPPPNPFIAEAAVSHRVQQPATEMISLELQRTSNTVDDVTPEDAPVSEKKPYPTQEYTMCLTDGLDVGSTVHDGYTDEEHDSGAATVSGRLPPLPVSGSKKLPPLLAIGPEFKSVNAWGSLPPIRGASNDQSHKYRMT